MHAVFFSVLLLQSFFVLSVQATLYVTQPTAGSTCSGGKPCTVQWLDDGTAPLLSQIGPCYVALYNGDNVLVQQIQPADISSVHSLEFTPDPNAGPNSGKYYINFTSVNQVGDPAAQYTQFSPNFVLNSMTGSLASPVASDVSAIPVPTSVLSAPPNSVSVTSTVPAPSTSSPAASSGSASASTSSSQSASGSPGASSASASSTSGSGSVSASASASTSASASEASASASSTSSSAASDSASSTGSASASASPSFTTGSAAPTTLTVSASATTSGLTTSRATSTAPTSASAAPATSSSAGAGAANGARAASAPLSLAFALVGVVAFVSLS